MELFDTLISLPVVVPGPDSCGGGWRTLDSAWDVGWSAEGRRKRDDRGTEGGVEAPKPRHLVIERLRGEGRH